MHLAACRFPETRASSRVGTDEHEVEARRPCRGEQQSAPFGFRDASRETEPDPAVRVGVEHVESVTDTGSVVGDLDDGAAGDGPSADADVAAAVTEAVV